MESCGRCGRKLKTKKSIEVGYGPICYQKQLQAEADAEFEKNQLTIDEAIREASA